MTTLRFLARLVLSPVLVWPWLKGVARDYRLDPHG